MVHRDPARASSIASSVVERPDFLIFSQLLKNPCALKETGELHEMERSVIGNVLLSILKAEPSFIS
jgi:hypothetical protein